MRGARQVEVNEPVTKDDHKELLKHARNSAEWYCSSSMKTEGMIRSKLLDKGYPNLPSELADGSSVDYIEEALEYCRSLYLVHSDESYANEVMRPAVRSGKSPMEFQQKLMLKGINPEAISDAVQDYPSLDALEYVLPKAHRSSGVRKAKNENEVKQKLIEFLRRKGFRYGDIREVLDSNLED